MHHLQSGSRPWQGRALKCLVTRTRRDSSQLSQGHGKAVRARVCIPPPTRSARDKFLQEPILLTAWEQVSVRELIRWAAIEVGGVHYDPKDCKTTDRLNPLMRFIDSPERRESE